jgi:hypothetical protein
MGNGVMGIFDRCHRNEKEKKNIYFFDYSLLENKPKHTITPITHYPLTSYSFKPFFKWIENIITIMML